MLPFVLHARLKNMRATPQTILMRVLFAFLFIGMWAMAVIYFVQGDKNRNTPKENIESSLIKLLNGNARFVKNEMEHPGENKERKLTISKAQYPCAVVVSCSDSRVPPELIFDQGLGDLFVIRTAGNLVDSLELGSIEYAVEHLGVNLVVVLGHENCGVIKAYLEDEREPNHIAKLLYEVGNEREEKEARQETGDETDNCVRANVKHIIALLRNSEPMLKGKYKKDELAIAGARYDLDEGEVEVIE